MSFSQLLSDHGYLVVFVGCFLEGETILVLAGFAAHQGYLSLPVVLTVAFVAGSLGDQIFYWIGRRWGPLLAQRVPDFNNRTRPVVELLRRYDAPLIVGIRFMYGLRILGPIAIGGAGVPPRRFTLFNLLGAIVWAPLIGGLGYVFGHALEALLGDLQWLEQAGFVCIVVAALLLALVRRFMHLRSKS